MKFYKNKISTSALFFIIFIFGSINIQSVRAAAPLLIFNIQTANITATSATVAWTTEAPGTSQAIFVDNSQKQPYKRYPEPLDSNLTMNHSVTAIDLLPNTTYTYYVVSADSSGNIGSSSANPLTFATTAIDTSGSPDFRVDTIGGHDVYAGSDLYYGFSAVTLSGTIKERYYPIYAITGLPDSISAHVICAYNTDPGNETADNYGKESCMGGGGSVRLRTTSSTPAGKYTATITFRADTLDRTYTYTFNVLPAPVPIIKKAISSIPPIPGLAAWENNMTTLGKKRCDGKTYSFGWEADVWYYDGGKVYLQVGDYTHNPAVWLPCAENILNQYETYVNANKGGLPAWRKFSAGAAMHYWRYGDEASKQAVINLYNSVNTPYINTAAPVWAALANPNDMRELAYAIESMVYGEEIGQPRSPYLARAVDGALAQYDQLFVSDPWRLDQPFFDGLMARALIKYYDLTKDPRVPPAVKNMLDWMWTNGVNHQNGKLVYNPLDVPPNYISDLTNLLAPAYAWYWNISGDPAYLTEGDFLFSHALDTDISYSGKIYSQNYAWSFDYVRYRSGNPLSTTDPADPANAGIGNSLLVVPVAATYNFGLVTLKNGSTGNAVKELQRFLNDKLNSGLVADGKLGPKTISAIKKWQKNHGLVIDGIVGVKTKATMNTQ